MACLDIDCVRIEGALVVLCREGASAPLEVPVHTDVAASVYVHG